MNDASLLNILEHFALSIFLREEGLRSSQTGIYFISPSADKNLLSSSYVPGSGHAVVTRESCPCPCGPHKLVEKIGCKQVHKEIRCIDVQVLQRK